MKWLAAVLLPLSLVGAPALGIDSEPTVSPVAGLPDELSDAVKAVLDADGHRVEVDGTVIADFWLRDPLPLEGVAEGVFGVEMGAVTASALVGVVRFHDLWVDYRETELDAGVYTLRYFAQPADGDHMGVSEYRDFFLVCPSDLDVDPDRLYEGEELLELSQEASGRVHPAVVAAFPVWDDVAEPTMVLNEIEQWTLAVPLADRTIGFVVEGHGDLP